jgi:hypothetical protein
MTSLSMASAFWLRRDWRLSVQRRQGWAARARLAERQRITAAMAVAAEATGAGTAGVIRTRPTAN